MKKNIFIILFLIVISFGIRILYADSALWYDEACSWMSAVQNFPFGIMDNLLNTDLQHTPLYFFLLHFWMNIFGQNEFALRILSIIFGVGTILLVYIVSRKISNQLNSVLAAMICSVSPILVLFSAEVRMYPVVIFLVILSVNFLIDFEQQEDKKSLIKLVCTNIFIPYTFVGGILYNISLLLCYGYYLYKNNKNKLKQYLSFTKFEYLAFIPYFCLIIYYAKMRADFVISHEGVLKFAHIIDVIRNSFGATIENNIYWVNENYTFSLLFCIFVVVPCVYFICGYIKSLKSENKFIKTISFIFLLNFIFAIIFSLMKINVMTVRYILYILPPILILSVIGLSEKIKPSHLKIFALLFILSAGIFSVKNSAYIKTNKELSFKSPAIELQKSGFNSADVVIFPFGSDAPYYFRSLTAPKMINFDFHKIARNPYGIYYDKDQQKIMSNSEKYEFLYKKLNENNVFSQSFVNYFNETILNNTEKGAYAILVMYGSDNKAVIPIEQLRFEVKNLEYIKNNMLDVLFKKYMCDIVAMLNYNFKFVNKYSKDNFTYYIYQKN